MFTKKLSARMLTVAGATALALGAASSTQALTDTSDIAVTATVATNCTISTTTAVAFGAYDPTGANASTAIDQTGLLAITCTNGSDVAVTLSQGDNETGTSTAANPDRRMSDGDPTTPHYLNYGLYTDVGHNTEWDETTGVTYTGTGTAGSLTVYATLPGGQNVPAGSYADLVVATVTF
jgi:spore coat protein U-like protein